MHEIPTTSIDPLAGTHRISPATARAHSSACAPRICCVTHGIARNGTHISRLSADCSTVHAQDKTVNAAGIGISHEMCRASSYRRLRGSTHRPSTKLLTRRPWQATPIQALRHSTACRVSRQSCLRLHPCAPSRHLAGRSTALT